jgi:Tfp pilus assembly protein PilO
VFWHSAAVVVFGLAFAAVCTFLAYDLLVQRADYRHTLAVKRARLQAESEQVKPLRGLAKDIAETRVSIARFYSDRMPETYSQILGSVGEIAIHSGVSLSHVSYSQGTLGSDLSEVSMDVSVAGEYPKLMQFVNGIERNHNFFIVRALSFTGQQGGDVTLHVRISTWLRTDVTKDSLGNSPEQRAPAHELPTALAGGK